MNKPAPFQSPSRRPPVADPVSTDALFGRRHNATRMEQATGIAADMHRRLSRGDDRPAQNLADRDMLYSLVGRGDVLPAEIERIIASGR